MVVNKSIIVVNRTKHIIIREIIVIKKRSEIIIT